MKKLALITFALFAFKISIYAQNNVYPTSGDVQIYGYSPALILQRNTSEGGFVQGIQTKLFDGTNSWFFGTLHGNEFRISKGDYQDAKLVVNSNGYVGIGTTAPNYKLDIQRPADSNNNIILGNFKASGPFGGSAVVNIGYHNDTYLEMNSGYTGAGHREGSTYGDFNIVNTVSAVNFYTNNIHRMKVATNGNVGIGTTNPQSVFEVNKSTNDIWTASIKNGGGSSKGLSLEVGYGGDNVSTIMQLGDANGNTRAIFKSNGNVGIGTTNPQNKLDVTGTIRCTEVKVEAPWADFVFHPTYKLRTLGEVEQFIKANSHLPEIPTAAEVKENGVSLGQMNAKLLQKVEELTLYVIEQNKKIQDLEKQNQRISELEEKIDKLVSNKSFNL